MAQHTELPPLESISNVHANACLATTTRFDLRASPVEKIRLEDTAKTLLTIGQLADTDHAFENVRIVDSSPDEEARSAIMDLASSIPGVSVTLVDPDTSRIDNKATVIDQALDTNAKFILLTEPDKWDMLPFWSYLMQEARKTDADLLIPTRTTLDSYPETQAQSEQKANERFSLEGRMYRPAGSPLLDVMFGPQVHTRGSAELYLEHTPKVHTRKAQWTAHNGFPLIARNYYQNVVASREVGFIFPHDSSMAQSTDDSSNQRRRTQGIELVQFAQDNVSYGPFDALQLDDRFSATG